MTIYMRFYLLKPSFRLSLLLLPLETWGVQAILKKIKRENVFSFLFRYML